MEAVAAEFGPDRGRQARKGSQSVLDPSWRLPSAEPRFSSQISLFTCQCALRAVIIGVIAVITRVIMPK